MITRFIICLLFLQTLIPRFTLAITSFNLSHFIYPKFHDDFRPEPSLFLKDVLDFISERQNWNSADVRVSNLDLEQAKYGNLQRYEISMMRLRKSGLGVKLLDSDEVSKWKKFRKSGGDFERLVNQVSSKAVLDPFKIEGPFELRVGQDEDEFQLMLPLNSSHAGLKRIVVGEGITVEVRNAQEVSLTHSSQLYRESEEPWTFGHSLCVQLLPISILGSATVVAYRTRNPAAYIESGFLSGNTIELFPEKCYFRNTNRKQGCPIDSLRLRINLLEKVVRISGEKTSQNAVFKAKIRASMLFRFQLELERDIRSNDTLWTTLADWRTRPTVEHVWFEIVARNEVKRLKPILIKKVKPFVGVDTSPWSNLMSNISFTKIPSALVPPESLTLDVKW